MASSSKAYDAEEDDLCYILWQKLSLGENDSILKIIKLEKYKSILSQNSLEIVPVILKVLHEDFCTEETEMVVETILLRIASLASPKEALLVLLEQLEVCQSDKKLKVILEPLQCILLTRIPPEKISKFISWAFNAIYAYIESFDISIDYYLEGEEVKLLDCHSEMRALYDALRHLLRFFSVFHEKILDGQLEWTNKTRNSRQNFTFYLLRYIGWPFSQLDVYHNGTGNPSAAYDLCERFIKMINEMLQNPLKTLNYVIPFERSCFGGSVIDTMEDNDSNDSTFVKNNASVRDGPGQLFQVSLATYYYCLFHQNFGANFMPCIYSPVHLYSKCVTSSLYLFYQDTTLSTQKALFLLGALLGRLDNKLLSRDCLGIDDILELPKSLVHVMIYSQNKSQRNNSLAVFKSFVSKFDDQGQIILFHHLLNYKHAGFVGLIIHELKECVAKSLKSNSINSCFLGKNLHLAFSIICNLKIEKDSTLLDRSDRDMAALNLILFVILCDRNRISGIHEILPKIKNDYLDPLHSWIMHDKAGFKQCIYESQNHLSHKKDNSINFSINNEDVPSLSPEQELCTLKSGLTWLDLLESIWTRVENAIKLV